MKILGGKELLKINTPKLIYEYNRTPGDCRELLKDPTIKNIINGMKHNIYRFEFIVARLDGFSVWVCDNNYQVIFDDRGKAWCSDINVVGDAEPWQTLWFVFEESEWIQLDKHLEWNISSLVNTVWGKYIKELCNSNSNKWAIDILEKADYSEYRDIINANIEIQFK